MHTQHIRAAGPLVLRKYFAWWCVRALTSTTTLEAACVSPGAQADDSMTQSSLGSICGCQQCKHLYAHAASHRPAARLPGLTASRIVQIYNSMERIALEMYQTEPIDLLPVGSDYRPGVQVNSMLCMCMECNRKTDGFSRCIN